MLLPFGLRGGVIYTNLVMFNCTNGSKPAGPLLVTDDGSFLGVTAKGLTVTSQGSCFGGGGTIFLMTTSGVITTLAEFVAGFGNWPSSGVVKGRDGNLYGATAEGVRGGSYNGGLGYGTIFQLSSNNILSTLYEFDGTNGALPYMILSRGVGDGFYGVTLYGGIGFNGSQSSGQGTVFKLGTNGILNTIHAFDSTNGFAPEWLSMGVDGNLYGTTSAGGSSYVDPNHSPGFGTIFRITTNDLFTSFFSFNGTNGYRPCPVLAYGSDGSLYGVTGRGGSAFNGSSGGFGTIFRLTLAGELTTLYEFTGGADGGYAYVGLIRGTDDNFYGTTINGGANGQGTLFRITPAGVLTTIYAFIDGGGFPRFTTEGKDGRIYVNAMDSGTYGNGNIDRFSIPMPPVFQSVEKNGVALNLTWSSVAEQAYQLQYISDLNSTNWTNLGTAVTATNGTMTASDTIGAASQRFYRVVLLP